MSDIEPKTLPKPGDIVILNSGSPGLTVTRVFKSDAIQFCDVAWFDSKGDLLQATLSADAVTISASDPG